MLGVMPGGTFGAKARNASHPPAPIFIVTSASASFREGLYISMKIPSAHMYILDGTWFLWHIPRKKILVVLGVLFVSSVGGDVLNHVGPQGLVYLGDLGG